MDIIRRGLREGSKGLSAMAMRPITLDAPHMGWIPLARVSELAGAPDTVVAATYLGIQGDLTGHLILMFDLDSACRLVDFLLQQPPGATVVLDDMGLSALAEAGNICGSHFLNAIADGTGLQVVPTAPAVAIDMAGAILQTVVTPMFLAGEEALLVETRFGGDIPGHFSLLPHVESMNRLLAAVTEQR